MLCEESSGGKYGGVDAGAINRVKSSIVWKPGYQVGNHKSISANFFQKKYIFQFGTVLHSRDWLWEDVCAWDEYLTCILVCMNPKVILLVNVMSFWVEVF